MIRKGKVHGCIRGFKVELYSKDGTILLADGNLQSITDSTSVIKLKHFHNVVRPDIGDMVIIDPVLWNVINDK